MKFRVLKNADGIFKLQIKKNPFSKWKDSENTPKYPNNEWIIVTEFGSFIGKKVKIKENKNGNSRNYSR